MKRQSIEKEVAQRLLCNTVEPGNRKKDGGKLRLRGKLGVKGGSHLLGVGFPCIQKRFHAVRKRLYLRKAAQKCVCQPACGVSGLSREIAPEDFIGLV